MTKAPQEYTNQELRKFGFVMTLALTLVSLIIMWRGHWNAVYILWGLAGLIFLLPALLYPPILRPLNKYWMKLAMALGWFNARLILGLMFYGIFTPVSLIQKIIRRDPLHRKIDKEAKTYWEDRSQEEYNPNHFERQF